VGQREDTPFRPGCQAPLARPFHHFTYYFYLKKKKIKKRDIGLDVGLGQVPGVGGC
jgi:hypothetical protein